MTSRVDKQYLTLQFKLKVHQKGGAEFQGFFEEIMEKASPGKFKKIRPYGSQGDGGNDGYIPDEGLYFQVYATKNPAEKDAAAAKKFRENFETLKKEWNEISKIKTYNFVFNDKYSGSTIELEKVRAELEKDNPGIQFKILLAPDVEQIFAKLSEDDLVSLGFDVDSRNALKIARDNLRNLEIELDRGNIRFVFKTLENLKTIVEGSADADLLLEFELIEARTLQRLEKFDDATEKYKSIYARNPKDVRALLYLAEISLNSEDLEDNEKKLAEAAAIDSSHWLYILETLIRNYRLKQKVEWSQVDESKFPADSRIKADFYRLYALLAELGEDDDTANRFVEQAIHYNPDRLANYEIKLAFLEQQLVLEKDKDAQLKLAKELHDGVEAVLNKFKALGEIPPRNEIFFKTKQSTTYLVREDYEEYAKNTKEIFELAMQCHFDFAIDRVIANILKFIDLPKSDFERLIEYLGKSKKVISDDLGKGLFLQFLHKGVLFTEGKEFFKSAGKQNLFEIIESIETKNYAALEQVLGADLQFAVSICVSAKSLPELRKEIIKMLPSDGTIQKEKLNLLLDYDEGNIDNAFDILKSLDLSQLSYVECQPTLAVAKEKKAWDFVIILLEKILQYEKQPRDILQIKLQLFSANLNLDRYSEVISIGKEILDDPQALQMLNEENQELVTCQTAYAYLKRGKFPDALDFLEKYKKFIKSFQGKVGIEAEIYLKNRKADDALKAVVDGAKAIKRPSPEEYGSLFLIFSEIGNLIDFPLVPLDAITLDTFVKIKGEERWIYIGDGEELDAIKVPPASQKDYLGKKVGEKVVSSSKFRSDTLEREIENILPIEKYVLWQSTHYAHKLSLEGAWDKMQIIEVPMTDGGIDPKYLIAMLEEQQKRGQEFFNTYCEQNLPFALLVVSQGNLPNALGRLSAENRGFIKANAGTQQEMEEQKTVAEKALEGQEFYLDGTSALFLSETGLLKKIHTHLPGLKVPQSVISLLLELKERLHLSPGQVGHMHYANGKIGLSEVNVAQRELLDKNFEESIQILESNPKHVGLISSVNKSDKFSEQDIPAALSDACILAQKDDVPVLTDDFLYLQFNEIETKKKRPPYFSTLALVRVMYEKGLISFEEYLNFFSYLASYRVKFLPISIEDLEKAVFGDGTLVVVKVDNLDRFNLNLTLSEEYGVPYKTAVSLILRFIIKLLLDDAVLPEVMEAVFTKVVKGFPTKTDKKVFGRSLVSASVQVINRSRGMVVVGTHTQEKIDRLAQYAENFDSTNDFGLILP